MLTPRQHITDELAARFERIRADLEVPEEFPPEALALADERAALGIEAFLEQVDSDGEPRFRDRRDIALSSIDPAGSLDLDQAFAIERRGPGERAGAGGDARCGYVLHYAIADVGSWVTPGDAIDVEARRRGMTVYSPDQRIPLHPPVLSEGAASLLEGQDRPAVLWTIGFTAHGEIDSIAVERAIVRNRRALTYRAVQEALDSDTDDDQFLLLRDLGTALIGAETRRGGISLELPEQSVERVEGHYEVRYDAAYEVESFNAQLSLSCGMAAARLMIANGVGILRTLPPAEPGIFDSLRISAATLGIDWPAELGYADWVRTLDATTPEGAALMNLAARTLRGSDYLAFDNDLPDEHLHAAIAAPYAHVTAPLRRLVDRFANECVLAAAQGRRPHPWALEALGDLPAIMARTGAVASRVDRAAIDLAEAAALLHLVGTEFDATVTASRKGVSTLLLRDPAVIHTIEADLAIGTTARVRLANASLVGPEVTFELVRAQAH